jgi:hypothetical protein
VDVDTTGELMGGDTRSMLMGEQRRMEDLSQNKVAGGSINGW